jgi:hypothetical protein
MNGSFGTAPGLRGVSPWIPSFTLDLDDEAHDRAFVLTPKAK